MKKICICNFLSNKSITLYNLLISTLHSLNRAGERSENLEGAISIAMPFDGSCFVQSFPRVSQNLKTKNIMGRSMLPDVYFLITLA